MLFCMFLIMSPIRVPFTDDLIWPEAGQAAVILELYGPAELHKLSIKSFRISYRSLKNCPSVFWSAELPEFETCYRARRFYEEKKKSLEEQRKLYGRSRQESFEQAIKHCQDQINYWHQCQWATGLGVPYKNRRESLQNIQLMEDRTQGTK